VIGATGFVGRRVVAALVAGGHRVRCMVRDRSRAADLSADGFDVVRGDMLDAEAVSGGSGLRRRRGRRRGEHRGRLPRERGTPAAVRMVVGHGGDGFGMVERGARRRAAILLASPHQRFRTVAVDDLAHQLVALLDEPRSFGQHFDVGSDDVLTIDEMVDLAADHLGRRQPAKIHLPRGVLAHVAPLIERAAEMPPGAIGGFVGEGSDEDMVGDATAIRALLERPPRPFHEAMTQAIGEASTHRAQART